MKVLLAGADVAMLASALLGHGPAHLRALEAALARWLEEREYESVEQLKGSVSQSALGRPRGLRARELPTDAPLLRELVPELTGGVRPGGPQGAGVYETSTPSPDAVEPTRKSWLPTAATPRHSMLASGTGSAASTTAASSIGTFSIRATSRRATAARAAA